MTNLLKVQDLRIAFRLQGGEVDAVRGVSFRIRHGSVMALVGESGSGKSVTAQAIMGLLPRSGLVKQGKVLFADPRVANEPPVDLLKLPRDGDEIRAIRGERVSKIFQEPMTSLSPLHTIGNQVEETLTVHRHTNRKEARAATEEMLHLVGFPNPSRAYDMYPFELSGGLRQRAMIAMALICRPALLIADEPTTALDVTIQAQILALLRRLQRDFGMAVIFITHNLGVVYEFADRVEVMYGGRIVESAGVADLFARPRHPYTKALLASVPVRAPEGQARGEHPRLRVIEGSPVDPRRRPEGCGFAPRCALARAECRRADPPLVAAGEGRASACLLWGEL